MSFINIIRKQIKIKSSKTNNQAHILSEKGLMKKLILSIITSVFIAVSAYADDVIEMLPGIWWEHVPAVCIDKKTLYEYSFKKDLQPLNRSFGRENGTEDGDVVYIITYWVNIHNDQSMATVQVPGASYECVLFRTFDMELNPNFDFAPKTDI